MNEKLPEDTSSKKICIACKQEYQGELTNCPADGTLLTPVTSELGVGSIIAGKYEVLSVVGGGAMGLVYKARHTLMKRIVAVKVLRPNMALDETTVSRFQKESEALSVLDHPNILTVFDFGLNEQGQPYLVTDYLEGDTVAELLNSEEIIPYERVIDLFKQVASALAHAHKNNVVHRDMKPSNIMLVKNEENEDKVKILDFGIAKVTDETEDSTQLTKTGEVFGSPLYMSPEQCRGKVLDARSDIYSVGCVMYRALTGSPPIVGQDLIECLYKHVNEDPLPFKEINPDITVPMALESVVLKCLMKDPQLRFQSMAELRDALILAEEKAENDSVPGATVTSAGSITSPAEEGSMEPTSKMSSSPQASEGADETMATGLAASTGVDLTRGAGTTGDASSAESPGSKLTSKGSASPSSEYSTQEIGSLRSNLSDAQQNKILTLIKSNKVVAAAVAIVLLIIVIPVSMQLFKKSDSTTGDTKESTPKDKYSEALQNGINQYQSGNYYDARTSFVKAYSEAKSKKLSKEKIATALHHLISASAESKEDEVAKTYLEKLVSLAGIKNFKDEPKTSIAAEAYMDKALLLMKGSDREVDQAESLTKNARTFYESREGFAYEIMHCLFTLGQIKILQGDFESATSYMNQAVLIAKEDPSVSQLEAAIRQDGLGDSFLLLTKESHGKNNFYKKAKEQYEQALKLRRSVVNSDDDMALSQSYMRLGILNFLMKNFDDSMSDFNKCLAIREAHGTPLQIAEVKRAICRVLMAQKKLSEAKIVFNESLEIARQTGPKIEPQIKKWKAEFRPLLK